MRSAWVFAACVTLGCGGSTGTGSASDAGVGGVGGVGGGVGGIGGTGGTGGTGGNAAGAGGVSGAGGVMGACQPTDASCYIAGPAGPGAACLAKKDNAGSPTWQGRFSSLTVSSPAALAVPFVQDAIIDKAMTLDEPTCFQLGKGLFNWLFELDPTAQTLKTGSGLPVTDPQAGACWADLSNLSPPVLPIVMAASIDSGGAHFHAQGPQLIVPIFASSIDTSNAMLLPLHQVEIDAKFDDPQHDCIGKFNGDVLDPADNCVPTAGQRAWTPGGTVKAFITIDESDQVMLPTLGETLCVLLAADVTTWKGPAGDCKSSAAWQSGQRPPGDWCAATNSAATGSCMDAFRFDAAFSASGFPIDGPCP